MTNWRPLEIGDYDNSNKQVVRFIDNELNRCERKNVLHEYILKTLWSDGKTCIENPETGKEEVQCFHYSRFEIEIPEAKFAGVKVSDWVEIDEGLQVRVVEVKPDKFKLDLGKGRFQYCEKSDGSYSAVQGYHHKAIRIVPAKDVMVDFGAFRGTIRRCYDEAIFVDGAKGQSNTSIVNIHMLTPEKQAYVKELLAAIEKEKA